MGGFGFMLGCSGDDLLLPNEGIPAELRAVSGDGQTAQAGDPLLRPLVVEVLDRAGNPVPGAAIVFEFVDPAAGADISNANTTTDADGQASAEVRLGNAVGDQPVNARVDGGVDQLRVQFAITALKADGGGGKGGDGDGDDDGNGHGKGKGHGHDDDD